MKKSSKGFLFGAATAAHQVEGNNVNSDFWVMENVPNSLFVEPSGTAVDHYHQYREDISLLAAAGLNSFRFSIEWARIEPENGQFSKEELEHYRDVLQTCYEHKITPIVTLHHFTSPRWLIVEGGWISPETPRYFARYVEKVFREIGELIPYACTINEANMGIQIEKIMKSYGVKTDANIQVGLNTSQPNVMIQYHLELCKLFGVAPDKLQPFLAPHGQEGMKIIMAAHEAGRTAIKKICPATKVGITLSLLDYQALPGGEDNAKKEWYSDFEQFIPYLKNDDFFGLQNYSRQLIDPEGVAAPPEDAELTQMPYENYPQALENVIRYVARHLKIPIIITENGIATNNDEKRMIFIKRALEGVHSCIESGIEIQGYIYWSLLDNFEWMLGYSKTFGLIEVDRKTMKRTPKKSLYYLGEIALTNELK